MGDRELQGLFSSNTGFVTNMRQGARSAFARSGGTVRQIVLIFNRKLSQFSLENLPDRLIEAIVRKT